MEPEAYINEITQIVVLFRTMTGQLGRFLLCDEYLKPSECSARSTIISIEVSFDCGTRFHAAWVYQLTKKRSIDIVSFRIIDS